MTWMQFTTGLAIFVVLNLAIRAVCDWMLKDGAAAVRDATDDTKRAFGRSCCRRCQDAQRRNLR